MTKLPAHYKDNPEEVRDDRDFARDNEVRIAERKAKKLKRYVYTPEEARMIEL